MAIAVYLLERCTEKLNVHLTALLILVTSILIYALRRRDFSLPPGPTGLPILGNILQMIPDVHVKLSEMGKKYGDVFTVHLGPVPVVVLNSYEAIREAFVHRGSGFSGRPQTFMVDLIKEGRGLGMAQGNHWKEQRKFTLGMFRQYGFQNWDSTMESKIHDELENFIGELQLKENQPFDVHFLMGSAVSNITCNVIFGRRFEYTDSEFLYYLKLIDDDFKHYARTVFVNAFPCLRHLPGDLFWYTKTINHFQKVKDFVGRIITQHIERYDENNITDFIDAYIKQMRQEEQKNNSDTSFTLPQLQDLIWDLFLGGSETTTTTLRWALAYMIRHPDVQEKVYREISMNIGTEQPSFEHRRHLPYTEAVLAEIQRLANIFPLAVPHATTDDVEFRGYVIPKGTMVFPNIYNQHMDEDVWENAQEFNPMRFIDGDGQYYTPKQYIPFGIGKRVCPGETMARMQLFLFFTTMIQQFVFTSPNRGGDGPSLKGHMGITISPEDFDICATRRVPNASQSDIKLPFDTDMTNFDALADDECYLPVGKIESEARHD
ncbi:unnamed protein product [Owenia fusiformis]|uniref:Uncharacterized protein n=1 Tax=Owenia fusiformis TaxID=6347 RepID=A0A8J1TL58_OWEFU|nr:unnamed protein product [Owenia fusiformis]